MGIEREEVNDKQGMAKLIMGADSCIQEGIVLEAGERVFKSLMSSLYNSLSLGIIWDPCDMFYLEVRTEALKFSSCVTWPIVVFLRSLACLAL